MTKRGRLLFVFLLLLCTTQLFADKKKAVEPTLEGEAKVQFDYAFMEGVRCKILGDLKSAIACFDQCMKIYNRSAAVRYELSSILALGDDYTLPLQLMREAVELEPTNIWYNLLLANILQKKSMIEEACKVYDKLILLHPDREDFYVVETDLYSSVEKWDKAINVLDRYEKQFGISEPAIIEKAKLYSKMDDVKSASTEIMKLVKKYPEKTDGLPSIPRSLKNAGYSLEYYYGGDADFTNMRSYLVSSGIEKIISETDFPLSERQGKWGAPDHTLFQRFLKDLKEEKQQEPFFKIVQTSSSHEPFEVPFYRLDDKVLNAFAYADSCVGDFVRQYKETPMWKNTLIVLVPDHLGAYPRPVENPLEGHTIPLILIGGAVKEPRVVDTYASQIDIAATLLSQLGLPHDDFTFSKNIFNPSSPHFGYFTEPTLFGMVTAENQLVYNMDANTVQIDEGTEKGANLEKGKDFIKKLYDDLAKR